MMNWAPKSLRAWAQPLPLLPQPTTTAILPAFIMSGVVDTDSRHLQDPLIILLYRLWTHTVVSSEMPQMSDWSCGYSVQMLLVRLAPLPSIMLKGTSLKHSVCWMHHNYSSSVSLFWAWNASLGNGSCCLVLGREDIAAGPLHLTTQADVGLTEDSCLHGNVQADSNMAPFSDLEAEYISCMRIRPGILFSARSRALRPQAARLKSVAL